MVRGTKQYVGVYEIAVLARVSPQAVSNWRVRSLKKANSAGVADPFPKPLADLASGPVFLKGEVMDWLGRNDKLNRIEDQTERAEG